MKKLLLLTLILFSYLNATSFDCKKASTNIENAICRPGSWNLENIGELDSKLADDYNAVKKKLLSEEKSIFLQRQRKWLKQRNKNCNLKNGNKLNECLAKEYNKRITVIETKYKNIIDEKNKIILNFYEGYIGNKEIGLMFVKYKYYTKGYYIDKSIKEPIYLIGNINKKNIKFSEYIDNGRYSGNEISGIIAMNEIVGQYKIKGKIKALKLKKTTQEHFFKSFAFLNMKIPSKISYEYRFDKEDGGFSLTKQKNDYDLYLEINIGAPSYNFGRINDKVKIENNLVIYKSEFECTILISLFDTKAFIMYGMGEYCGFGMNVNANGIYSLDENKVK